MNIRFDGKHALITGGGRGIGREVAVLLSSMGAKVTVIDRIKEDMDALSKEIGCETIHADLRDPKDAKRAAEKALPVDLLVNCAGVVILGGVSSVGGIGDVAGVVFGIFILRAISSGFNIIGFSNHFRNVIWGSMLVLVTVVNHFAPGIVERFKYKTRA